MKESALFTSISTRSKRHIRVIFYFPIGAGMHLVLWRFSYSTKAILVGRYIYLSALTFSAIPHEYEKGLKKKGHVFVT